MRSLATLVAVVLLTTTSIASNVSAETSLAEKLKQRVATLTLQLESSDVAEQLKAVEDLAELRPLGAAAVPQLARLTQSKDRMKILFWDRDGFCIWYKRLERGTFQLLTTTNDEEGIELDYTQLVRLLGGLDLRTGRRRRRYHRVG